MTKRSVTVNQDPHFDGERENIIADTKGKQVGLSSDAAKATNPFRVKNLKKDPDMEAFNQTMKDY
ncbi:hypothetical protein [Aquibacillus sediminis]|uniref:hypothetical protein n=1 Tax=Aquibacillus sediminis TaxID=2574734 RepID=UPI0011087C50|nr:hypothetical protein [Aquibacillus sediminis]